MNKKYILTPHPIAEKCTLWEALHWVAFNYYPAWYYSDNCSDLREDTECCDGLEQYPPDELDSYFTKDVCDKYGLIASPLADYIAEHEEPPYATSQELIDTLAKSPEFSREELQKLIDERKIQDEFDGQQEKFDAALDEFLEEYKAELFLALRKGYVKASGHNLMQHLVASKESQEIILEDLWAEVTVLTFEEIPKHEWHFNTIQWQEGLFQNGNKAAYCHILLDVESLFAHFPEPILPTKSIHCINGILIDSGGIAQSTRHTPNKIGRPSYDWKSFQAEMASRLLGGVLPALQKACVIEMGEWCIKEWGECPSETNLKNNISPFYAALRKSEIK